jgi:hypothetical protein
MDNLSSEDATFRDEVYAPSYIFRILSWSLQYCMNSARAEAGIENRGGMLRQHSASQARGAGNPA